MTESIVVSGKTKLKVLTSTVASFPNYCIKDAVSEGDSNEAIDILLPM